MKGRLIALTISLVLAASTYLLGYSTIFTVSAVDVVGTSRLVKVDIQPGERLARVEPRAVSAALENLAWIESAEVSRNWIEGKVTVKVVERKPIATFKNQVIDVNGKSFIYSGKTLENLIDIQAKDVESATKAVNFFIDLPRDIQSTVNVVKVRASGAFVLDLENNGKPLELRWGLDADTELKLQVFKALLTLPENAEIKRIDVSAPHAPIVK